MNKLCNNLLEKIIKEKRDSDVASLRQNKPSYNPTDTNDLVAAVAFGKGLSNRRPAGPGGPMGPGAAGASGMLQGSATMQSVPMSMAPNQQQHMPGVQMAQAGQPGKMPSNIKTDIESASMHPYQR